VLVLAACRVPAVVLLLCSDGRVELLRGDPADLASLIEAGERPGVGTAAAFTELALAAGGRDNITVCLIPVGTPNEGARFDDRNRIHRARDQNQYLSESYGEVGRGGVGDHRRSRAAASTGALEILIMDVSGSMQGEKIVSARRAAVTALDQVRDGVSFALIAGASKAQQRSTRNVGRDRDGPAPASRAQAHRRDQQHARRRPAPRSVPGC